MLTTATVWPRHHTANLPVGEATEAKRELSRPHVNPSGNRLHTGSRGKSGSTESDEARAYTRLPTTPGKVDNDQARNNQTTTRKSTHRGRGQVLKGYGHGAAWQTHSRALQQVEAKRGQCASATPNGNDKIERLSEQDRSGRVRPICLWAREGNGGTLPAAHTTCLRVPLGRLIRDTSTTEAEPPYLAALFGDLDDVRRRRLVTPFVCGSPFHSVARSCSAS